MRSGCWGVLSLLLLLAGTAAFKITRGPSVNHLEISERAILDVTVQTCRTMAEQEGRDFVFPPRPLTASGVIRACDAAESSKSFLRAIKVIQTNNKRVDISRLFNPAFHFDDETFEVGRAIITDGLRIIKDSNKLENFEAAREKLGEITHPLQVNSSRLAEAATVQLLDDIRGAAGDTDFLRMVGITKGSIKALCFVIDTTESMSDEINAVKNVTASLVDSKVGTPDEPSLYILVPFNDPEFGPLMRTTDPNVFKTWLNSTTVSGGGDFPEMSLSGLQLALAGAPPGSEIFLFTDAAAKDIHLEGAVIALIERTKTVVNFILTGSSKFSIRSATTGNNRNFSFSVDESLRNLNIYITGNILNFTLTSPSGVSQNINSSNDSLATMKIMGQSGIDFLFDFVQFFQGPSEGFDVLENRPVAGGNATLLLTLTGLDSGTLTNVSLVEASGALGELSGKVEALGGGDFLARFDTIPSGDFVVRLKGRADGTSRASTNDFQRQSSGSLRASALTVTTTFDGGLREPGSSFSVPFTVTTNGTGGNFTIQATNDQGLNSTFPSQLELASGGSAKGTVTLTTRLDTPTGTAVTLTIQAQSPGGNDTNYVVLRLSIVSRATDNSKPVCRVTSVVDNCTPNCSQFTWEVRANLTDDNSTGIDRIALQKGNGTLNNSTMLGPDGENVTLVVYNASCCSPDFKLVAVDGAGNVGFCFETIRNAASTTAEPPVTTTTTTTTTSLATNLRMSSSCYFWQTILVMLGFMVMAQC
ncbi:hypothetical protein NHX12_009394 [Muraenolepis orangiensis]|uniref:von Willebrand factor A domain-containing protein 7-like n=1 Tax=Muraenolepis orangiensis TaxID=630683 RepID=A0A9Q0DN78_9TELE|nr:hypothetical protein NHX12_009394 [Muraenolepis orangiensis]